jgi:D-sedoheptulose 7-phosphate isomerase
MNDTQKASVTQKLMARVEDNLQVLQTYKNNPQNFVEAVDLISGQVKQGHHLFLCGNGGSATTAAHMINDLIGHMHYDRPPIRALSLNENTSNITMIGNDYGFEFVFSKQLEAMADPGDVLLAISTSGNSANVVKAAEAAHQMGIKVVGFTNQKGGKLAGLCDVWLPAPTLDVLTCEDFQVMQFHALCLGIEEVLFSSYPGWGMYKK